MLPPETSVYVLGESTPRDVEEVGDMGEEELAGYYGKRAPLYAIGGLLLSAGCLYYILSVLL